MICLNSKHISKVIVYFVTFIRSASFLKVFSRNDPFFDNWNLKKKRNSQFHLTLQSTNTLESSSIS